MLPGTTPHCPQPLCPAHRRATASRGGCSAPGSTPVTLPDRARDAGGRPQWHPDPRQHRALCTPVPHTAAQLWSALELALCCGTQSPTGCMRAVGNAPEPTPSKLSAGFINAPHKQQYFLILQNNKNKSLASSRDGLFPCRQYIDPNRVPSVFRTFKEQLLPFNYHASLNRLKPIRRTGLAGKNVQQLCRAVPCCAVLATLQD